MQFNPTGKGIFKFPQEFKDKLLATEDRDFRDLANMDGQEVYFMGFPQPALNKKDIKVYVNAPIELTIHSMYIIDKEYFEEE